MIIRYRKLADAAVEPRYAHGADEDAGLDLCASEEVILHPNVPTLVKTGIALEIPSGYFGRILDRSGLALKHGIHVHAGVIDPAYRGDVGVVLVWGGQRPNVYETPEFLLESEWFVWGGPTGVTHLPVPRYNTETRRVSHSSLSAYRVLCCGHEGKYQNEVTASPRYVIAPGDRIAQLVIQRYERADMVLADALSDTVRAAGGFGSTGA